MIFGAEVRLDQRTLCPRLCSIFLVPQLDEPTSDVRDSTIHFGLLARNLELSDLDVALTVLD